MLHVAATTTVAAAMAAASNLEAANVRTDCKFDACCKCGCVGVGRRLCMCRCHCMFMMSFAAFVSIRVACMSRSRRCIKLIHWLIWSTCFIGVSAMDELPLATDKKLCGHCRAELPKMRNGVRVVRLKCAGCKGERYCNAACQLAHWPRHKPHCGQNKRVKLE